MSGPAKARGASLLEVIVAIGILGFGLVTFVGYAGAVADRLRTADELAEASLCEAIRAFLQAQAFTTVIGWLDQPDRLRADRSGRLVATAEDPLWTAPERPFYTITLWRRSAESPASLDATAARIAFDIQVSGPGGGLRYPAAIRR